MPMALRYAALSLGQAALGLASCSGTSRISGETWQAALSLSRSAEQLQFSAGTWSEWSKAWRPLAMEVVSDFDGSMADCPEGSVAALGHGLLAVDEVDGHFSVLELGPQGIIKMMHHKLSDLQLPAFPLEPAEWQQHWLMVVSSMLRFMYLKWVNMPHDNDFADMNQEDAFSPAVLRPHHDFLFRNFVDKFLASGVYDLSITENTVLYSEAFAFLAFCHLHQVDFIAESGVYKGVSTEIWSLFAKEVAAVDIFLTPEAEERLQRRSNVELHTGDGRTLLPQLLSRPGRRAAVFIDGPKGELAIHLALSLIKLPQVAFVAMHDMEPYKRRLRELGAFFFSDEPWFKEAYGHLDEPFRRRPDLLAGGTMAFITTDAKK
ncbi:unnamed protein product [Symbiodinium necroappetens]|uniref:Uncharacterized protein n=1 Tax=Symbiodinium necroappetens TaxID=1628268 RepID=A0A812VZY1_9DINO|nr:unnamed protein product [Symbiodinium necroappetens]